MKRSVAILVFGMALVWASAPSQRQSAWAQNSNTSDFQREVDQNPEVALSADESMDAMDMDPNPHLFLTDLQPRNTADDQRAQEILDILQKSIAKYKDYRVALADGYQIFLPKIPQPIYHLTNYRNAFTAAFVFNPAHPTSLLYRKAKDSYELVGAMFTAPKSATEQQLNDRVPLSVARWHEHVNLCLPPKGAPLQHVDWKQFGLTGSIATQDTCVAAGGHWIPQIFGWMVHVYPFETDPEKIWAR